MSAKTRSERKEALARFSSLQTQSFLLIESRKRNLEQVDALLDALQLFKENRLLIAIPKRPDETLPESDRLQFLLSLHLSDTKIHPATRTRLLQLGIEHVGELYLVDCFTRSVGKSVRGFLSSLDLPHALDLGRVQWRPPYLDKHFEWLMNQQTIQFLKNEELRRVRCFDKFEYLGDIFSRTKRSMAGLFSFWNLQNALRVDSGIRAGLYTPDWKRPI